MIRLRLLTLAAALCAVMVGASPSAQTTRLTPWLETALRQEPRSARHLVWIYLRDKGPRVADRLASTSAASARARVRRATRSMARMDAVDDLAVDPAYVAEITRAVTRVRHESRWLNAVSAEATAAEIETVAALPFVVRVDVVHRYRRTSREVLEPIDSRSSRARRLAGSTALDYGTGYDQVAQIRVPELHERGLSGQGVVVAVFDGGFPNLTHEAFATTTIVGERNFVTPSDSVRGTTDAHGLATLSTLGGYREGELVGPAYGATFLLAVTEDSRSETPLEEDNWTAAAEWAEAMGADVISSSLGYAGFDTPYTGYTDRDMDGATAVTTKAATMAAARGVLVVNSAGNGGFHPDHNTLGAPADGRLVLTIAAVTRDGIRAPFSSVGPTSDGRIKPDVAALGVRAKVAWTAGANAYAFASGTSFSCPLTAGVAALVLQAHPQYTVEQAIFALRSTASQADAPDNLLGWGIVDAVKAVDAVIPQLSQSAAPPYAEIAIRNR